MISRLDPLGDQAWLARFVDPDQAAAWSGAHGEALRGLPGVTDVVLAYESVAVHYDLAEVDPLSLRDRLLGLAEREGLRSTPSHVIEIPVLYDGVDLREVAGRLGLTVDEVVGLHSGTAFRVFALGFLPGFPYCGFLPERLAGLPRRVEPRTRVEAGSVALVGRQTGIYPQDSPGGWHVIGRTPVRIVDLEREHFPIRAGDQMVFRPIDAERFHALRGTLL